MKYEWAWLCSKEVFRKPGGEWDSAHGATAGRPLVPARVRAVGLLYACVLIQ